MTFETFDGPETARHQRNEPQLTVHKDTKGYLNAPADVQHYADADAVVFLTDTDENQLAIGRAADHDGQTYTLSRGTDHGANVYLGTILKQFGVTAADLQDATFLSIEWRDDINAGVVDLDLVIAKANGESKSDEANPDSEVACTVDNCSETFDNERGMKIHRGRMHDDGDDEAAEETEGSDTPDGDGDGDDSEEQLLTRQARAFVEDKGIRKLSSLAEALDVSPGQARKHARCADVYGRVQDDAVERPGVSS